MKNTVIGLMFTTIAANAAAEPIEASEVHTFEPNFNAKGILLQVQPETKATQTTLDCLSETINRHLNGNDDKTVGICYADQEPVEAFECENGTCKPADIRHYTYK